MSHIRHLLLNSPLCFFPGTHSWLLLIFVFTPISWPQMSPCPAGLVLILFTDSTSFPWSLCPSSMPALPDSAMGTFHMLLRVWAWAPEGHPWKSHTRQHSLNCCWLIALSPFLGGCCGVLHCTRPRPCLHSLVWNSLAFCPCLAILSSPSSCKGPYLLWPGSCPPVPEELALVPSRSGSPCLASPCLTPALLPSSPSGCSLALSFLCHLLSKSSSKIVFSLPQLFTIWSSLSLIGCSQKPVFFPRNQITLFTFAPWGIGC